MNKLHINFKKYQIFVDQKNIWDDFETSFKYVLRNDNNHNLDSITSDINYYYLQTLFSQTQYSDYERYCAILKKIVEDELDLIVRTIENEFPTFNLKQYVHVWLTYNNFCRKMNMYLRNFGHTLVELEIGEKKYSLNNYQMLRFYFRVIDMKMEGSEPNVDFKEISQKEKKEAPVVSINEKQIKLIYFKKPLSNNI